jgi:anti-sigma B factor antagonist
MQPGYSAPYLDIEVSGPPTVITMRGELDICSAPALEACVGELDFASVREVVLDLAPLDFIAVAGVRAVFALEAACTTSATPLTIIPGRRVVHRIFQLTGAEDRLPFRSCRG